MQRCIIYCRVSTDAQERDGTSLETQERACREFAAREGWLVTECVRDTASGFTLDRPGLNSVRHAIRTGAVDVVLCHDLDRLSRKQTHTGILVEEAEEYTVVLNFVLEKFEDTATGQLLRNVRAFAAELEREKIAERTMRGKGERARSGRLPQGTGKGMYGYIYNAATGRREIHPFQAAVVLRAFQRYAETKSFSAVSRDLNDAGLPAFGGGQWYPITVRTMVMNPAYVGRTVYRKTKRITQRSPTTGQRRSKVIPQPEEQWIEVAGGTPPIIDEALWERVHGLIEDPERLRRRPEGRTYLLGGRIKCGLCGSAMVGQTLLAKGASHRYYRCRHAYTTITGHQCEARYVRGYELEDRVWAEVMRVLTSPSVVLQEVTRRSAEQPDVEAVARLERDLAQLGEREKRLVRLYSFGEVEEATVREQLGDVRWQRLALEDQLRKLRGSAAPSISAGDEAGLEEACRAVMAWLAGASYEDRLLALEAMQVAVVATKQKANVSGVLPLEAPGFITDEGTSRCSSSGE